MHPQTHSGNIAGTLQGFVCVYGVNLHFLDRLLPFLRRVQRRVRQHGGFRANKVRKNLKKSGFIPRFMYT